MGLFRSREDQEDFETKRSEGRFDLLGF